MHHSTTPALHDTLSRQPGRLPKSLVLFALGLMIQAAIIGLAVQGMALNGSQSTISVTTTKDRVNPTDGKCSLREAITAANTSQGSGDTYGECPAPPASGPVTITLQADATYSVTRASDNPNFAYTISRTLTIDGQGARIARDSDQEFGLFHAVSFTLTLNNITLANGHNLLGGGVASESGIGLRLNKVTLLNNHADSGGGGAMVRGTTNISGTRFIDNTTAGSGGGLLALTGSTVFISNSRWLSNIARKGGGLAATAGSTVYITSTHLSSNTADLTGGGIFTAGQITLTKVVISDNKSPSGGGIRNTVTGKLNLLDSVVISNTAITSGGGLHNSGIAILRTDVITGNSADRGGGFNHQSGVLEGVGLTVSDNRAGKGGGGSIVGGIVNLSQSAIISNTADSEGGGLINFSAMVTATNNTFAQNTAAKGGGLVNFSGVFTLTNNTFVHNAAPSGDDIANFMTIRARNNIIASSCAGALLKTGRNNLVGDSSCLSTVSSGNILTDTANITDTLSPLQNNGGPTPTYVLLRDNPAIGAGNAARCPPTDQRGVPRDIFCSIGAYEPRPPDDVVIEPDQVTVTTGIPFQLKASWLFPGALKVDGTRAAAANWISDDPDVAEVSNEPDSKGLVTGQSDGQTTIDYSVTLGGVPFTASRAITVTTDVPDLVIRNRDGGVSVQPGGLITYTLTVINKGDHPVVGVVLTDTVPTFTRFVPPRSSQCWQCQGDTCTCDLGALLGDGDRKDRRFVVQVDEAVPGDVRSIVNTAVWGAGSIIYTDTITTSVVPAARDLRVNAFDLPAMVQEGSRYVAEVQVRNPGSTIPITITCTLTSKPAGSGQIRSGSVTSAENVGSVEISAENTQIVFDIVATRDTMAQYIVRGNSVRHTHRCMVTSAAPDPKPLNNAVRGTVQFAIGVDGDSDVDKDDLRACRQYFGMEVSVGNTVQALCDIDGNRQIDDRDLDKMREQCTRPGCARQ